jgi:hypothetical protein
MGVDWSERQLTYCSNKSNSNAKELKYKYIGRTITDVTVVRWPAGEGPKPADIAAGFGSAWFGQYPFASGPHLKGQPAQEYGRPQWDPSNVAAELQNGIFDFESTSTKVTRNKRPTKLDYVMERYSLLLHCALLMHGEQPAHCPSCKSQHYMQRNGTTPSAILCKGSGFGSDKPILAVTRRWQCTAGEQAGKPPFGLQAHLTLLAAVHHVFHILAFLALPLQSLVRATRCMGHTLRQVSQWLWAANPTAGMSSTQTC